MYLAQRSVVALMPRASLKWRIQDINQDKISGPTNEIDNTRRKYTKWTQSELRDESEKVAQAPMSNLNSSTPKW